MKYKVLLIDDEPDIIEFISYNLEKEGLEVHSATSADDGIALAKSIKPDIILLDVMMPDKDGIEACQELRKIDEFKNTLIVFLSARAEDFAQLAGYQAGANDYIVKVVKPKILASKVKALLQIGRQTDTAQDLQKIGALTIDKTNYNITLADKSINLPRKEFELLCLLASNTQKVFKREEILDTVWGKDVIVGERTIDVHIRRLREKLGIDCIQTLKGVGYKLVIN